ncbi:MAG: hypothetical protein E5X51_28210 [Mesorhizobium sp.]|nr:MAG: hypothetical protein E5X51_28210 [Mesorhizobium sp.]
MAIGRRIACCRCGRDRLPSSLTLATGHHPFVIPGRSKERSDAAQTLESMPLHQSVTTVQRWRSEAPPSVPPASKIRSPQRPN